jgi:hypothetical protein
LTRQTIPVAAQPGPGWLSGSSKAERDGNFLVLEANEAAQRCEDRG